MDREARLEPTTLCLVVGAGDGTRTHDPLLGNKLCLVQAAPDSKSGRNRCKLHLIRRTSRGRLFGTPPRRSYHRLERSTSRLYFAWGVMTATTARLLLTALAISIHAAGTAACGSSGKPSGTGATPSARHLRRVPSPPTWMPNSQPLKLRPTPMRHTLRR